MSINQSGKGNAASVGGGVAISNNNGKRKSSSVDFFSFKGQDDIVVNGKKIKSNGRTISIYNGDIFVGGQRADNLQDIADETKATHNNILKIEISTQGDVKDVKVSNANLVVNGNIHGNVSSPNGTVTCSGDIRGDAVAMEGTISVEGDVNGDATATNGTVIERGRKRKH